MRSILVAIAIGLCLSVLGGCGGCNGGRPNTASMSPAEYFNKTQVNTVTPNGRIKVGSAESAGSGKIRYQTEDGRKWEATVTPGGKGYKYNDTKAAH